MTIEMFFDTFEIGVVRTGTLGKGTDREEGLFSGENMSYSEQFVNIVEVVKFVVEFFKLKKLDLNTVIKGEITSWPTNRHLQFNLKYLEEAMIFWDGLSACNGRPANAETLKISDKFGFSVS